MANKRHLAKQGGGGVQATFKAEKHSGPLPHPDILKSYEETPSGSAERIIAMAERQSAHRQFLEKSVIASDRRQAVLGTLCAFAIGVLGILAAAYCIVNGHDWAGGALGTIDLAAIIGTFVYGTSQRQKERSEPVGKQQQ